MLEVDHGVNSTTTGIQGNLPLPLALADEVADEVLSPSRDEV